MNFKFYYTNVDESKNLLDELHTFFNKNSFYKNHEAQISKNLRIF